jgi:hypothetical protein
VSGGGWIGCQVKNLWGDYKLQESGVGYVHHYILRVWTVPGIVIAQCLNMWLPHSVILCTAQMLNSQESSWNI